MRFGAPNINLFRELSERENTRAIQRAELHAIILL